MRIKGLLVIVLFLSLSVIIFSCDDPEVEDTVPPTVAITSPQNNSTVNEIIQVICISIDNDRVEKVELWIDGSFTGIYDTSEPYSLQWNTTTYENKTYTITIRSFDVSGNAADSSPFSFTVDNTLSVPTASNIASISYGQDGFTIIWDKSTDDDFESYSLEKSLFANMSDQSLIFSSLDIDDTVYVDSNIDPLVFQYYRVTVTDSLNYSSYGMVDTSALDAVPSTVDVESVSYDTTSMIITWEESSDSDFLKYELYQSRNDSNNYALISTISEINVTEYSMNDFDPLQINYFKILVYDTLGQYTQGKYFTNDIDSPPNSVDVNSVSYTLDEMVINWEEYIPNLSRILLRDSDGLENDFASYDLLYSDSETGNRTIVASISDPSITSYSETEFDPTHENWYWVKVNDYWGQTSIGIGLTNTIEPLPQSVNVLSVEYDLQEMTITWEQSTEEDFLLYKVYHSLTEYGESSLLATYDSQSTYSHIVTEYDPTHENWFKIEITDMWDQSVMGNGLSNTIDAYPLPVNVTSVTYDLNQMIVVWNQSGDEDFKSYELLQNTQMGGTESLIVTESNTDTSFALESFDPTIENSFQVKITDIWGLETLGTTMANSLELPPTPVTLNPISFSGGLLNISWSQNAETDFQGYSLYESQSQDMVDSQLIFSTANQEETSFTRSAEYGQIRYYQVVVSDIFGLEANSLVERGGEYILFNTAFGGSGDDLGYSVQETTDGGYIMAGYTESFGNGLEDVWLVKTDMFGIEEWTQTYGNSGEDIGKYIQATSDGGFIITGSTQTYTENARDVYLVKTDEYGNELWSRSFGGLSQDGGECVKETMDGGYIITGEIVIPDTSGGYNYDLYLIKTDINGIEEWSRNFGGNDFDWGYSVVQSSDGGFVVAGIYTTRDSTTIDNQDLWVLKTDSEGLEEWNQTYGDQGYDVGYALIEAEDGGFVITGMTAGDTWLLKIDFDGMEEWSQTYFQNNSDHGNSIEQTSDGGFIIAGVIGGVEGLLIKANSMGEDEWSQIIGGNSADWFNSVQQTTDGGFILSGSTRSFNFGGRDAYLVKTDPEGNTVPIE
ncbi:MAG: hypothetical protein ISR95_07980 [Candidatus Marinimicrobia bacterium]|nr:hypothetical protein [Candidatus Neomarinimicrobiota bacterium]